MNNTEKRKRQERRDFQEKRRIENYRKKYPTPEISFRMEWLDFTDVDNQADAWIAYANKKGVVIKNKK